MIPRSAGVLGLLMLILLALTSAGQDTAQSKERILRRFAEEFVPLTPGEGKFPASFSMGGADDAPAAEKPRHKVTFRRPFAMARYEVTQELYEVIMGKNPSRWKGPRNSVEVLSWEEARDFCKKATGELRTLKLLTADEEVRLPSEAEWEYACRAGTTTRYSFGDDAADLGAYAWFKGNSKGEDPPVGRKKPNAWGLYDMHGYVWEWCQDAWHADYEGGPTDGTARETANARQRVLRSGSWADSADHCRSAFRQPAAPDQRSDAIGFRCVRSKNR